MYTSVGCPYTSLTKVVVYTINITTRRPYSYTGFVHDPSVLWTASPGRTVENGLTRLVLPQPLA